MKAIGIFFVALVLLSISCSPTDEFTKKLKAQNEKLQTQLTNLQKQNDQLKRDIAILKARRTGVAT